MGDLMFERAKRAIDSVHGDTSVPISKTIKNLEALRDEIDILIDMIIDNENARP